MDIDENPNGVEIDENPDNGANPQPPSFGLGQLLYAAVLLLLLVLLGRSMVHHRFFHGGRVHANGSIGQ